jgi:hypothetical protein
LEAVAGFTHDFHSIDPLKQRTDTRADQSMIVCQ